MSAHRCTVLILMKAQLSVHEQRCFLSAASYLFNKHLLMNNNLHSVFIRCPALRRGNHFYRQNAFILSLHYFHLCVFLF